MWVVFEIETGWSSEDMRFAERDEALEFMRMSSERGYDYDMRWEQ